jgi:hypothetical protein
MRMSLKSLPTDGTDFTDENNERLATAFGRDANNETRIE